MKKILLLIIISFYLHSINAQNENKDYNVKILFLNEYPYTNVLDYLHNPDTLVFFNYKPRRYQEKKAPFAINLFIYRKTMSGGQRHCYLTHREKEATTGSY